MRSHEPLHSLVSDRFQRLRAHKVHCSQNWELGGSTNQCTEVALKFCRADQALARGDDLKRFVLYRLAMRVSALLDIGIYYCITVPLASRLLQPCPCASSSFTSTSVYEERGSEEMKVFSTTSKLDEQRVNRMIFGFI